jgi:hypothetical protein
MAQNRVIIYLANQPVITKEVAVTGKVKLQPVSDVSEIFENTEL